MIEKILKKLSFYGDELSKWIAIPCMVFYTLLTFAGVLSRFVFKYPIAEAVELARVGFVWSCLMGSAIAFKRHKHIQFSVVTSHLTKKTKAVIDTSVLMLTLVFIVWILIYSISITIRVWPSELSASGISNGFLYLPLPIAMAVMMLHCLLEIVQTCTEFSEKEAVR